MTPRRTAPTKAQSRAALMSLRPHFDRSRLPDAEDYYAQALPSLKGRGTWRDALCPFHEDTRPSLRVNVEVGGWRCMSCGRGGDLLSFHMKHTGQSFKEACVALGAWTGGRHD